MDFIDLSDLSSKSEDENDVHAMEENIHPKMMKSLSSNIQKMKKESNNTIKGEMDFHDLDDEE